MSSPGVSPKSSLRKSILGIYRGRGHGNNNLWLVYSVKTNKDWVLPSDRQLVHWLYYLESNPDVASFDLAPDRLISHDGYEARGTELDAVAVYRNGQIEWHEVIAEEFGNPEKQSQSRAQVQAATAFSAKYRRFNDRDFKGAPTTIGLRWLKPLAFAEVIRDQELIPYRSSLAAYCEYKKKGVLKDILNDLNGLDSAALLGMLTRFASENIVTIDLTKAPFGPCTKWHSNVQR